MTNEIIAAISQIDKTNALSPYLESNAAEFEKNPHLAPKCDEFLEWCKFSGLDRDAENAVMSLANEVVKNKTLLFLYFHCSRLLYDFHQLYPTCEIGKWPSFDPLMPGKGNLFLLLLGISIVPRVRRIHQSLKIPTQISKATCEDVASRVSISKHFKNGEIGISLVCLGWLRHHADGELFQLGRLQFHPIIFGEPVCVFRRKSDGETLIFSEPEQRFTQDGFYDGAGKVLREKTWSSIWDEKDGILRANCFSKAGRAIKEPKSISLS
jgi:hypothetical protein